MKQTLLGIAIIPLAVLLLVNLKTGDYKKEITENKILAETISVRSKEMVPEDKFQTIKYILEKSDNISYFTNAKKGILPMEENTECVFNYIEEEGIDMKKPFYNMQV